MLRINKLKIKLLSLTIMLFAMAGTKASIFTLEKETSFNTLDPQNVPVITRSFDKGFRAKNFYSAAVDENNIKWFLTDTGIVSFDEKKWSVHDKNNKVPTENLKDFAFEVSSFGPELWIATPQGVTVASLPVDARSGATTYNMQNTPILSDNILSLAIGKGSLRWFGTDRGISAFLGDKWLPYTGFSYNREYPASMFKEFPITTMATGPDSNYLYVGTLGGGVARVFRNEVDGISGASVHARWGPIEMPSDKVFSICITPDGTQWYGTDMGVVRHTGSKTLENWTVFNTADGLTDNFVQSIETDKKGNMWFGTKGGLSLFDGTSWKSYTMKDGLNSNNIQCIIVDKNGVVWIGTDNGVMSFNNGEFIIYR